MLVRAPLLSLLITAKWMELQKSLLETWKFFGRFLKTLTADDEYSLISSDNWMQTIQMHLSQEQNFFSEFFAAFFKFALNFKDFEKKMTLIAYVFPKLPSLKTCLDKCLTGLVWEDLSTCDMVSGQKHWFNINQSAFIILSDHIKDNGVAKVTLRDVKIL